MVAIVVLTASATVGKAQTADGDRLRDAVQLQRHLGDHAQRALRADEQPGQVVAGRGFARPAAGADDAAVGQHHGQPQHVVAHGAVAHRIGAGGAGRRHAAQAGVGAGVDREEQAGVAQMLVQLLARHPGLDRAVEVLGRDPGHPVHLRQVDGDAAAQRRDAAFQRGAGAVGHDRHLVRGADPQHRRHLLGRVREGDRVGRHGRVPGSPRARAARAPRRRSRSGRPAGRAGRRRRGRRGRGGATGGRP